ncbi:Haloacid dehalogenase domain protein hydrolase [Terriglobus saanensis SP1PR4]|uniref:Haloacid dehalogenase domain protein hydrolase n=2 Tax=Terriglobus saanensis TaxID=870903 RepID=E8V102_TERSS|nr:Haloacid dehalogenase domain protein hydrolase [Terriglobus saanensis SP1PR4]
MDMSPFEDTAMTSAPTSSTHSSAKGSIPGEIVLSTKEFREAVWEMEPKIAVFDCDGTLWSPDAGSGFLQWTIDTGLLSEEATQRITARHQAYHQSQVDELTICGEMVQIYEGLAESDLRASARAYFEEKIEPHLFPEMIALIQELQASDVEIWAVSSTNDWMIEEALQEIGITHEKILATCVEVRDGIVTGVLRDIPTDEGKAKSLRAAGISHPDVVFGNSVHDAAMLEIAKRAFPVNPSEGLQKLSVERNWPVYYPAAIRPL